MGLHQTRPVGNPCNIACAIPLQDRNQPADFQPALPMAQAIQQFFMLARAWNKHLGENARSSLSLPRCGIPGFA
jgi:hypothetical protein